MAWEGSVAGGGRDFQRRDRFLQRDARQLYSRWGVLVPLLNLLLGEIVYGGLGTGLYSMAFVALVALFIGGLMVGRSPEHLGRRLGPPEMKIIAAYTLLGPATVLVLTALAVATPGGSGRV